MDEANKLALIVSNPEILGGRPIIKGTRISVGFILELVSSGATPADIHATYPHIPEGGVEAALLYAARQFNNDRSIEFSS